MLRSILALASMADLQAPKLGGYRSVLKSGLQQFAPARDFQHLFSGAEHRIVEAEHGAKEARPGDRNLTDVLIYCEPPGTRRQKRIVV